MIVTRPEWSVDAVTPPTPGGSWTDAASGAASDAIGIACLADWENIKVSIWERQERLPNPQALVSVASTFGPVVIARAYANFQESMNRGDSAPLYAVGIDPVSVPTRYYSAARTRPERVKNSVDVRLAIDATEIACRDTRIGTFLLATGDGDLLHLVRALQRNGKRVIVTGNSWNTSRLLMAGADHFMPYDIEVDPPATGAPTPLRPILIHAFQVLAGAVLFGEQRRLPNREVDVRSRLAAWLPSFNPLHLGLTSFGRFLDEAERHGYVVTEPGRFPRLVRLPRRTYGSESQPGSIVNAS